MPSALDIVKPPKVIINYGPTGSGKTTLFTTLPGNKMIVLFDPGARDTIAGVPDLDYMYFPPGSSLGIRRRPKGRTDSAGAKLGHPDAYNNFEMWYEEFLASNEINNYTAIAFSSLTTLQVILMERILDINGKFGTTPELSDYNLVGETINAIIRTTIQTAPDVTLFMEAHSDLIQDNISKKVQNILDLYKGSRKFLPRICTDVLVSSAEQTTKGASYRIQAQPSREWPSIKNSMGLNAFEDVTIDPDKPRDKQALGRWMNRR